MIWASREGDDSEAGEIDNSCRVEGHECSHDCIAAHASRFAVRPAALVDSAVSHLSN